jgi:hypothetical protein
MNDYTKQLEQQIEHLTKKLAKEQSKVEAFKIHEDIRNDEILRMTKRICELITDYKNLRVEYDGACELVAKMHKAAMGETCGPRKGVVEDVAELRFKYLKLKEQRHDKHRNRSV